MTRSLVIVLVFALPPIWLLLVWLGTRNEVCLSASPMSLGDVVNVAVLIFTGVGVYIAVASYRQAATSAQQHTQAAEQQAQVLDAARRALDEQLAIVKQQRDEYLAELARRPRVEVTIERAAHEQPLASKSDMLTITVDANRNAFDFVFLFRNTGDEALYKPLLLFVPQPEQVKFEPRQFSQNTNDLWPYSQSRKDYEVQTRAIIPADIDDFVLTVDVSGANMQAQATTKKVHVVRASPTR